MFMTESHHVTVKKSVQALLHYCEHKTQYNVFFFVQRTFISSDQWYTLKRKMYSILDPCRLYIYIHVYIKKASCLLRSFP